jgi:integrase
VASVFRQRGRGIWQMQFRDQHGNLHKGVSSGMRDRRAAEALASMIERDAERLRAGMPPENADLTGPYLGLTLASDRKRPLEELIDLYKDELVRRGSPEDGKHVRESERILKAVVAACGWKNLACVRAAEFSAHLANLAKAGKAPRTQHGHHAKLRAFLNWCVQQHWLHENPVEHLQPVKVGERGRRYLRRGLTPEELRSLLGVAGPAHRLTYQVAAYSGFRRKELRLMQRRDASPEGGRPRWAVRPEITKNGRGAELPMLPDCARAMLPHWQSLPGPESPLLAVPAHDTFRKHLKKAKIAPVDERGRHADFHSLRYTFCTWMSRRHPIEVVQRLMRHSTIRLTADLYADLGLEDIGKTVWTLPPLLEGEAPEKGAAEPGPVKKEDEDAA